MIVIAADTFGVPELHAFFQWPAEEQIVFGEQLVERYGVFLEFRVVEIRGQRIEENFVALCFDEEPGHSCRFTGGPIQIAGEAGEYGDGEFRFLDDFLNGHLEGDVRMELFFSLLVGPGDCAAIEPPGARSEREEEVELGFWIGVGERSEEHTSELQSRQYLVCRLLLEKKK